MGNVAMKSIYSMYQASYHWNKTFHKAIKSWAFLAYHMSGAFILTTLPLALLSSVSMWMTFFLLQILLKKTPISETSSNPNGTS